MNERIEARSEDDVLSDAAGGSFRDEIFDETSASENGSAERPGERRHVRTIAPSFIRRREREAELVFEYMRGRIDFQVQRPPQCRAYRRAVWRCHYLRLRELRLLFLS